MSVFIINSNRFFNKKALNDINEIPSLIGDSVLQVDADLRLSKKPNIYFIAIESYGAILYENEIYTGKYKSLTEKIAENLLQKNYKVVSTLSESTVSGGMSWLAFSSFLKGIAIKSDSVYRQLFYQQSKYKTQSVFEILEELGYTNYLVNGLGGFENYTIEWDKIKSFLGTKNVLKYTDLNYKGLTFNFGPSSPDQYLLNKSRAIIKEKVAEKPFALFVETINSHYKFESPTKVFDNWEKCNNATLDQFEPLKNLSENTVENYFKAIEYQLKTLEDFILNEDSDAIFVLFGDHQPPILTTQKSSYNTPVHIVSSDNTFINYWIENGFEAGLFINENSSSFNFHHANFKKKFVAIFTKTFQQ